jgi:hypothetical protein
MYRLTDTYSHSPLPLSLSLSRTSSRNAIRLGEVPYFILVDCHTPNHMAHGAGTWFFGIGMWVGKVGRYAGYRHRIQYPQDDGLLIDSSVLNFSTNAKSFRPAQSQTGR